MAYGRTGNPPATEMERIRAGAEVQRKYPQMFKRETPKPKESWVKRLKKQVRQTLKGDTTRTKGVSQRAKDAGLTDTELRRMR